MTSNYANERLKLFNGLLKERSDIINGRLWVLEPKGLRFKHGNSIAELKIPYHMGAEDESCIETAILSLVSMLVKRYEPLNKKAEKTPHTQLQMTHASALKDKTFKTDIFIADTFEKSLAEEILFTTPYIDSAILSCWLGPDGDGRKFISWAAKLFEKTITDEAKIGGEERTTDLTIMAVIKSIRKKKDKIKDLRAKGLSYERLDLAVGLTLFTTFKHMLRNVLKRIPEFCTDSYNPLTETLLQTAVVPMAFLAIPSNLLSVVLNPYNINSEVLETLSELAPDIDENTKSIDKLLDGAAKQVRRKSEATTTLKLHNDILLFRQAALKYMTQLDIPGSRIQKIIYEVYGEDRLIKNMLSEPKGVAELNDALEELKSKVSRDPKRKELTSGFQHFLSSFKKKRLGGLLKGAKKDSADAIMPSLTGYYAYRIDQHVDRFRALMRGYLSDRRGEYTPHTLIEEYNKGRLYRFSTDTRPILKTLTLEEEGQLFIDMKDFSKKTLKVKEIAMADFMKENFFMPILKAAAKYGVGSGFTHDERGITLTNIPGDAVIFSGGVTYLVALAKDIQRLIRVCRAQLALKMRPRKDKEILAEIHERFKSQQDELKKKRLELNKALEKNESGIEKRLIALGEEEHQHENMYREELKTAIKDELEAGLYISYGAKAETMLLESTQNLSGPVKVSVGEKINEAARGTFRHPSVRAKLEMLLNRAKQQRKTPTLRYPFDIYIDRTYSIKMPPEIENAFEHLLTSRKESNAQALTKVLSEEYLKDLKSIISGEPFSSLRLISSTTDIYNKGEALSSNALEAYIRETKGKKRFFKKIVPIKDLDKSIRDAFFFPSETLELWFGVEKKKNSEDIEIFYNNGKIIFKGFETATPVVVYEILNTDGAIFKALVKYHFKKWSQEAAQSAG